MIQYADTSQKKTGVAMLIEDDLDFKVKNISVNNLIMVKD